jgi:hypothetical protein
MIALLFSTACGERQRTPEEQQLLAAESTLVDTTPMPQHADSAALARVRGQLPADVLVRRNACPFECCVYGNWLARSDIPFYPTPRPTGPAVFTLSKGEKLRADSGIVYITSIALAVVDDTVVRYRDQTPWLLPGDTLVLLEPIGEGYWTMWRRGEILNDVPPFFESIPEPRRGRLIGTPRREWWVHATINGRRGWFNADSAEVLGADACGGPVEGL